MVGFLMKICMPAVWLLERKKKLLPDVVVFSSLNPVAIFVDDFGLAHMACSAHPRSDDADNYYVRRI